MCSQDELVHGVNLTRKAGGAGSGGQEGQGRREGQEGSDGQEGQGRRERQEGSDGQEGGGREGQEAPSRCSASALPALRVGRERHGGTGSRGYTPGMRNSLTRLILLTALVGVAGTVNGEVTRVDIARRTDVGTSGYEKIVGTIHFAVDPGHPRNRVIVDLDAAKKNAAGRVEFSADLFILRPRDQARSNGVALVEVSNRGRKGMLSFFNRGPAELDPSKDADLGDGFLTRQGYTLVWVGWQFDVPRQAGLMKFDAPVSSVSGVVRAEFTTNDRALEHTLADLAGYSPSDPAAADATLTVRDGPFGATTTIPRRQWRLRGNNIVSIDGGFEPGRTYEVAYRAANLPVAAAGLAAFRDTASWIKYRSDATVSAKYAYTFGSSQSGRFLRAFLYYGFNSDEQGRQVFDGVMAHIAGTGRLSLNERGATPNALSMYTATKFPFSDARQRDPNSGRTEGLLDNDRARQNQPKIFYTNTSVEYWGGGRAAALVHTTLDGQIRSDAAGQRARVSARRDAAPARAIPAASEQRAADRQPGRVCVDAARAAHGDGSLGPPGHGAAAKPASAPRRRIARRRRSRRVPGDSGRRLAPHDPGGP